jgi:hypothetical protein
VAAVSMVELHQLSAAMDHQHCVDTNDGNDGYQQAWVMPVRFWFKSNELSCHGVKRRNDSVCKSEIDRFFLLVSKNSAAARLSVSERADFLHYITASYVVKKEAVDHRTQIDFCGYISSIFCSSDQIPFFLVFGDVKISSNIVSAFLNGEYWAYDKMVFGSMIVSITILCIAADIYELFVHGGA